MIREVKQPIPVLEAILECLLIGYRYDAAEGSLELVTDNWREPGADRTFLRVRFGNVSNFKRIRGLLARVQRFTNSYSVRSGPFVVQIVRIDQGIRPMHVFLGFGDSFGGIEFSCESILAHSRNALATKRKDEEREKWDYRDADDGTPLDFYEPFTGPFG
jgi:hypothetical protein